VYAVVVADDVVFLDVQADRYVCLPEGAATVRLQPGTRRIEIFEAELEADLERSGLIEQVGIGQPVTRAVIPPRPTASARQSEYDTAGWRDAVPLVRCLLDMAVHYRGKSLADLLRMANGRRRPLPLGPSNSLLAAVADFHRWQPYAPVSGKCLLQSFLLLRHLQRARHDAQWVFGVTTWPFKAHCWLQVGAVVLDDTFERLELYHPILVV
jgi:hypothetical protein